MNINTNTKTPYEHFFDGLTEEIIAMPDEQVLEDADSRTIRSSWSERLSKAKAEAGLRRLTAAKAGVASNRNQRVRGAVASVPAEEARRYILSAANDPRYTLAARNLNEMSDEDVLRLYSQMKSLESLSGRPEEPNT